MTQRARVTRRVLAEPDHRGRARLLAREGAIVTAQEAIRRGIPEDALEPIGPAAAVTLTRTRIPLGPARQDGRADSSEGDGEPRVTSHPSAASSGSDVADGTFPRHRGGPWWELSNGKRFQGNAQAAAEAEAALHEAEDDGRED